MKKIVLLALSCVVGGLMIGLSLNAYAQTASSVNWDSNTYYQGDSGTLTITLYNSHPYQICTKQFALYFDWLGQGSAFMSSSTPCIATGQSYQFSIPFNVPASASVGQHSYDAFWVDQGFLLGTVTINSGYLYIHDAYEKVYQNTASSVAQSINQAQNSNYKSPTAISDLGQAQSLVSQASTLANQGQFQSAVNDLNQAQSLLSQANAAEQSYQPPIVGGSIAILVIIAAVIIGVIIAVAMHRKKKLTPKS